MSSPVKKTVKAKVVAVHPKFNEMVESAISSLKERKGSSRAAILKYISANYKLGTNDKKINSNLKTCLRNGVSNGLLNQVKGTGATGSFKVAVQPKPVKKVIKKPVKPKKSEAKKTLIKNMVKKTTKKSIIKNVKSSPKNASPKKAKKAVSKIVKKPIAKKAIKKTVKA